MFKRVTIVALVVAAFLVLAVPALAWNGLREDYTTTAACQTCHSGTANISNVYHRWSETGHANAGGRANRLPYGSSCGGCHSSNFDPSKIVPTPTATSSAGAVSWTGGNATPIAPQAEGNAATSESFVGCSSCHYGANVAGGLAIYGVDSNDTAHMAPYANLANAEICGQCHSRYSYAVTPVPVASVPYMTVTTPTPGTPVTPNPSPTSLLQPQYAMGYQMLGEPGTGWVPAGLSTVLNVQYPGWTPTPDPAATTAAGLQIYWQIDGVDTPWQYRGHDGSANQYPDWKIEGHATALEGLKAVMGPNPPARCLECHSTDYITAVEAGKTPPTGAEAQYGITCVGCHTPHDNGTAVGEWSEEFHPQLRTDSQKTLCVTCHNGELPVNTEASPGAAIHHPMKEMIDGYGAIDVAAFPSVHKGKCVQCHMPPTTTSPTGGNHTFAIIEPEVASEARVPVAVPSGSPTPRMPYSSCSGAQGCHTRPNEPYALYLQDTIEQRQEWTHDKVDEIHNELDAAAVRLGYADEADARTALVAKAPADRTQSETAFLKAYTNVGFVESEGSFGLHNWDYSRQIVNTALWEARSVADQAAPTPWSVTFRASKTSIRRGTKVRYSGSVAPAEALAFGHATVTLQRRVNGNWQKWRTVTCNAAGSYSVTVKMTNTGTFTLRALMPAFNARNMREGISPQVSVRVRR
jgi:hypothetical protein